MPSPKQTLRASLFSGMSARFRTAIISANRAESAAKNAENTKNFLFFPSALSALLSVKVIHSREDFGDSPERGIYSASMRPVAKHAE
jgi:hypothetical protein